MTYDIERTEVEHRVDFDQFTMMQDHHDGSYTHDTVHDIGHLISVSSYQIADSPWTSPKHFYSANGNDHSKSASAKRDIMKEGRKENVPALMPKDAFRPVVVPNAKAEKRTSSLTSLLASDFSWTPSSSKNDEKRRQQYGDNDAVDTVAIHPGIGETVLNMNLVMSSGKVKHSAPIPIENEVDIDYEESRTVNKSASISVSRQNEDNDYYVHDLASPSIGSDASTLGLGHRRYRNDNMFQSDSQSIDSYVHREDTNDYHSEGEEDEMVAQSAIFQNILQTQSRHFESRMKANQIAASYDGPSAPGIGRNRHPSSSLLSDCGLSLRTVASFSGSVPSKGSISRDRVARGSGPPLVSAMRNKALTSTETAVARVRVASSAAVSGLSSESEDSSSDDDDDYDEGGNQGSSDISRRASYNHAETADSKDDTIDIRKVTITARTGRCFNFDLNGQRKSMIQKMKEKDRGKKKKSKSAVRFLTEGEFPPEFSPVDNVIPIDSTVSLPRSRAESISVSDRDTDSDGCRDEDEDGDGDSIDDIFKIGHRGISSVSLSNSDSRRSSSSTLNDSGGGRLGILETVGAAILTLFSSRLSSSTSTPSTTSTSTSSSATTTGTSTSSSTSTPVSYRHGHM